MFLPVNLSPCQCFCLSTFLPVYFSTSQPLYLSTFQIVHLSACQPFYLSVCQTFCLSTFLLYLPVNPLLSVNLYAFLFYFLKCLSQGVLGQPLGLSFFLAVKHYSMFTFLLVDISIFKFFLLSTYFPLPVKNFDFQLL